MEENTNMNGNSIRTIVSALALSFVVVVMLCVPSVTEAAITYFGSASTPSDNSTNTASPTAVTPPGSMQAGDLVVLFAYGSGTTDPEISEAGGQAWSSLPVWTTSSRDRRTFWARFNGTWSANPSVTMPGTSNNIVVMHVFRPTTGTNVWDLDYYEENGTYVAPSSPFTVPITGITTRTNGALAIAIWASADDNGWGSLSGAGWGVLGNAQYRNTSGSNDGSMSFAYQVTATAGATGDVSKNQTALGGDAGATAILAFREIVPTADKPRVESSALTTQTASLTFTMAMPSIRPAGDLYIALMCHDGNTETVTPPGGSNWNEIADVREFAAYWKIGENISGGNEAATYAFTLGGATTEPWGGTILRVTGFDTSSPINVSSTGSSASDAQPVTPTITPSVSNTLIIRATGVDGDPPGTGWAPSGHTEIAAANSGGSSGCGFGTATMNTSPSAGNSAGTATFTGSFNDSYGSISIAVSPVPGSSDPTVTTDYASNVGASSARLHGSIVSDGGDSVTQHGFAYSTNSTLSSGVSTTTLGSGSAGQFSEFISGLSNNQTYYFRAYATNGIGTGYGSIMNTTSGNTTPTRSIRLSGGQKVKLFGGASILLYPR